LQKSNQRKGDEIKAAAVVGLAKELSSDLLLLSPSLYAHTDERSCPTSSLPLSPSMTFQPPTKPSNAAMPALYLLFSSLHLEKHNRAIIDKLASIRPEPVAIFADLSPSSLQDPIFLRTQKPIKSQHTISMQTPVSPCFPFVLSFCFSICLDIALKPGKQTYREQRIPKHQILIYSLG
jgi:hypothetical protein